MLMSSHPCNDNSEQPCPGGANKNLFIISREELLLGCGPDQQWLNHRMSLEIGGVATEADIKTGVTRK